MPNTSATTVLLCGVGGQGTILAADVDMRVLERVEHAVKVPGAALHEDADLGNAHRCLLTSRPFRRTSGRHGTP